jgi:hypothetical protein
LAARRLNAALNEAGVSSSFYALENSDFELNMNEFTIKRTCFARILSGIVVRIQSRLSSKILFTLVSTSAISKKQILALAKSKNTIFHIHNWYNLLNESQIYEISRSGFPVVVTLHDQRLLTGGCHYTFDCNGFTSDCGGCPNIRKGFKWLPSRVLRRRKYQFTRTDQKSSLIFISPSRWMQAESAKSKTSSGVPNVFVPNVLGPTFDKPRISTSKVIDGKVRIGIASMDPTSYVKGGDVVSALDLMSKGGERQFELVFLTDHAVSTGGIKIFWEQIDLLLVTSRADNSPNVIHEAHHFGVPVIATQVGGISELLIHNFDYPISLADMNASYLSDYIEGICQSMTSNKKSDLLKKDELSHSKGAIQSYINMCAQLFPMTL